MHITEDTFEVTKTSVFLGQRCVFGEAVPSVVLYCSSLVQLLA